MDQRKAAAAAAAVAAAGIITSAAFEAPLDLLEPVPLIETVESQDGGDEDASPDEERQNGPLARFRARFLRLPYSIRALVGVPLWGIGWGLTALASFLWTGAAASTVEKVFEWLLLLAVGAGVFAASVKAAFPDLPVREILRPRNIFPLLGLTGVLALSDAAVSALWTETLPRYLWHLGSAGVLAAACVRTVRREKRRQLEEEERRAALPLSRAAVEELARRLADSVSPRRY